jgi:DNA-binding NarL/FixJ family response regulator
VPDAELIAALEASELGVELCESLAEVAAVSPSLVVLSTEGRLAGALSSDFEPLRAVAAGAPIVIVCPALRPGELRLALAAGAAGVVLEPDVADALAVTVRAALAGQVCVPRRQSQQVEPAALSGREKQILGLVVLGYSNAQIAEQLFLAESTVKSHLSSAFVKLGVKSRNEAVDLILDPERGVGFGILGLGGEPVEIEPIESEQVR